MLAKFLKAGNGDAILIQNNGFNIIIDGGNESKYLMEEVKAIFEKGEYLNLLVITHHDDDHIKGIIDLLTIVNQGAFGEKFIKKVVFNSPRLFLGKIVAPNERLLSYKQAHEVEELLTSINTEWQICTDESDSLNFGNLTMDFLSPKLEDIKEYSNNKGTYLTSDYKCDWNTPMFILDKYIDDKSQDSSIFNKNSVVIKLQFEGVKLLLTGDVTPKRLEEITNKLVVDNDGNPIDFDYVKLPHHGSYRSLNKTIIENLNCKNFIISTNGKKYFLPNKRALLKILKYSRRLKGEKINFIFNYNETLSNLNISEKELKDYNFMLTSNNKQYGFIV